MYQLDANGLWLRDTPVVHRDDEYDEQMFPALLQMQQRHFWYRGRHRFLLAAMKQQLAGAAADSIELAAVDLGGGCGGWIRYVQQHAGCSFREFALADSSKQALAMAAKVLPAATPRYQVDLLDLGWRDRWQVAFLLDVIEHLDRDEEALRQVGSSLTPGGLLFVTAPALQRFWTWNDEAVQHYRRYSRRDFARLAAAAGLELLDCRYFMFLLSPLYWLARRTRPPLERMSKQQINALIARTHRAPHPIVNAICRGVFAAETPLGLAIKFPWGTSILGVFRKP